MKSLGSLLKRLHRLSETLGELKERVREAVAGELSRVVASTVQDVVHAFLRGQPPSPPPRETPPERPHWRDDDPWADEADRIEDPPEPRDEPDIEDETPAPPAAERWQRALELGTTVLRWWLAGRWKPFVGFGVAGLAGAAAWWGGPVVHAGTSVILSAAELIALGSSHSLR
jgi:hypothetical protein